MDGAEIWVLGLLLLGTGVMFIVFGRMQRAGTLRRNGLAGIRTPQTLRSDEAWQAAHNATAGLITSAGVVQAVAAAALLVMQPSDDATMAIIVMGSMTLMLALVLVAGVRGHRIAARVNRGNPAPQESGPSRPSGSDQV